MEQEFKNKKKKILIKVFNIDNDVKLISTVFENTKFIKYDHGKFWIKNKYKIKYEADLSLVLINLNDDNERNQLIKDLVDMITRAHLFIQNIPDVDGNLAGDYSLRENKDEKSIVDITINRMLYNHELCNVLDMIALIIFNINSNHLYNNGNKRTSLASANAILRYFGYYLSFSYNAQKMLKFWETTMCDVASYKTIKFLKTEEKTIKYIKETIIKNLQIKCFKK